MAPLLPPISLTEFSSLELEERFTIFSKFAVEFGNQIRNMTNSEEIETSVYLYKMTTTLPTDYVYPVSLEEHLVGLSLLKTTWNHWKGNVCCFSRDVSSPQKRRLLLCAQEWKCQFDIQEWAENEAEENAEAVEDLAVAAEEGGVEEVGGKKKKKNKQPNKNKNKKKKKKTNVVHTHDYDCPFKTQPNSPRDSPPGILDSPPHTPVKTQPNSPVRMNDNLTEEVLSLEESLNFSGTEYWQKMIAAVSSMSFKMKFFQGPNQADKIVEEATCDTLDKPDWATNLEICDLVNQEKINSVELIRGIKKRIMLKNPRIQYLSLMLLEIVVKNCEKAFSEVASERVLDEMVKLVDDPQTAVNSRNKALMLIESWVEFSNQSNELRYLPIFEETYKSLRSRGIRFPGRDDETLAPIFTPRSVSEAETNATLAQIDVPEPAEVVKVDFAVARNSVKLLSTVLSPSTPQDVLQDEVTTMLVQQCRESQSTIMRIIETAGDNEALLFEALSVNDEIQKALSKYEDMEKPSSVVASALEPDMITTVEPEESPRAGTEDALVRKSGGGGRGTSQGGQHDDMMDDLDEMIFGNKSGTTTSSGGGVEPKKPD